MFLSINLADASKSNGVFDIALALMGSDFAIDQFLAFSAALSVFQGAERH